MVDRGGLRFRPGGPPIMHQRWHNLLFLHWKVPAEQIRPLLPPGLDLDTWEGDAWIGVTPFDMDGIRPSLLPAVPFLSRTHELNVRTYVHDGVYPGVWFFSLDASNPLAVAGARTGFGLPYHVARMALSVRGDDIGFSSARVGAHAIQLQVAWRRGRVTGNAAPGSLEDFLIERYCLYTMRFGRLLRVRIHHPPWVLREAEVDALRCNMLAGQGLPPEVGDPLVHAQGESLAIEVWRPERCGTTYA
jgi:uncharacterized protein